MNKLYCLGIIKKPQKGLWQSKNLFFSFAYNDENISPPPVGRPVEGCVLVSVFYDTIYYNS